MTGIAGATLPDVLVGTLTLTTYEVSLLDLVEDDFEGIIVDERLIFGKDASVVSSPTMELFHNGSSYTRGRNNSESRINRNNRSKSSTNI